MSIKDFFTKLVNKELSPECNIAVTSSEKIERVELSETPTSIAIQVSINSTQVQSNGFTILMQNAHKFQLHLPTFPQPEKVNRKQKLRNDIVDWIHSHGSEWPTKLCADTQGKEFIVSLTETIWYIDMHDHKKLEERNYHIPKLFLEFFGHTNPESYKQSRKPFDANELNLHCQALAPYVTSSWILRENFNWLHDVLDDFIIVISNYVIFLQHKRDITAKNHASEIPIRTIDQATTIKVHKKNIWITPIDKNKYYHLEQSLIDLLPWEPVDIEEYLPTDPMQRMRNNAFNAILIWKIDEQATEIKILQENKRIVSELQANAPRYHTRTMRINYLRTCELLLPKAKPSSLRTIYRMLTGDVSAAETANEARVNERVKMFLELGDPDITIDLREHNSGKPSKYDTFWKIAAQFLEGKAADAVTAVDERRHDTIVHLATAISVNDLLHQIERECPPETPIPSAQWLQLQFWPKNPTRLSSLQFTGLLPLKFME
ncbi:unnamed protein product [Rhizophagus irregularis]|nr:unnamed protein product [Rhizophagus irregularis]